MKAMLKKLKKNLIKARTFLRGGDVSEMAFQSLPASPSPSKRATALAMLEVPTPGWRVISAKEDSQFIHTAFRYP